MTATQRLALKDAKWFLVRRSTGAYFEFGFASKATAMRESAFANAELRSKGLAPDYAVTPVGPRLPPELKVISGGK